MKYRRLKLQELEHVEGEFVQFLAINGIDVDLWQKLKSNPASADTLINAFSDAWFETYLQKIQYVDYFLADEIWCFQFNLTAVVLVVGKFEPGSETLNSLHESSPNLESIQYSSKTYDINRESQIFELLEKGGIVSDGSRFKTLALKMADAD